MLNTKNKILYLKTLYTMPFKIWIEILSNVLTETTWTFTAPDKNEPDKFVGLEIATADTSNINVFYNLLYNSNYSRFYSLANIANIGGYSGNYLITNLAHKINPKTHYITMNVLKDSFNTKSYNKAGK